MFRSRVGYKLRITGTIRSIAADALRSFFERIDEEKYDQHGECDGFQRAGNVRMVASDDVCLRTEDKCQ